MSAAGAACYVVAGAVLVMAGVTRLVAGPLPGYLGRALVAVAAASVLAGTGLLWAAQP